MKIWDYERMIKMISRIDPRYLYDINCKTVVTLDLYLGKIDPEIGRNFNFSPFSEELIMISDC